MNKTLLLIICDFLLLNLLALTRWETVEPVRTAPEAAAETDDNRGAGPEMEIVALMRQSLEDERLAREALDADLRAREALLAERQQQIAGLEQTRTALETDLEQTRRTAAQLAEQAAAQARAAETAAREAELGRLRAAQLQRDLELREQEAARQREELARLEREQAAARERIESLNVAVAVAEREQSLLRENLEIARTEVAVVREEKDRIQQQAGVLAEGVGRLAERSGELAQEIRDHRPINANTLFAEFLDNQLVLDSQSRRPGLVGPITATRSTRTVLVSDGQQVYAILHAADTPVPPDPPFEYDVVRAVLRKARTAPGVTPPELAVTEFAFLRSEPRIALVPVPTEQVARLGVKVYQLATDPFRFGEAVLVSASGRYYGETEFRLDPTTPRHVRMSTRIFNRLFGEFSPSTGDLVFSKTGELLGVMVNSNYCAVVLDLPILARVPAGERQGGLGTRETLEQVRAQIRQLPPRVL